MAEKPGTEAQERLATLRERIEAIESGTYRRDDQADPDKSTTRRSAGGLRRGSSLRRSSLQRKTPLRRARKPKLEALAQGSGSATWCSIPAPDCCPPTERAAQAQLDTFRESGSGYFLEIATRPQTIGYSLLDSPIALAAWMLDHDTDSYYKISSAFVDGQPSGNLTRDHILDISRCIG